MHIDAGEIYSGVRPVQNHSAMHSPFVDSASSLSGEYSGEPLEPSVWERVLRVALVMAVAACSAALLMQ